MKFIPFFLILTLLMHAINSDAQNDSINCEVARNKYLELNPDVARAGMDAWNHYSNYGKREGRIWPPCSNLISEIANLPSNDSIFKDIASIGHLSKKEISQYNIDNIHNEFDFNEIPLFVLTGRTNLEVLKLNGSKEKELLDNFLRGVDSLPIIIKDIEISLLEYPEIALERYYKTSKIFSDYISTNNRIIVSKNYKNLNKIKDFGPVKHVNSSCSYLIIPPGTYSKRLEKKLTKLITKNKVSLINKDNVEGYIRGIYNVKSEYLELREALIKYKNMKDYASAFFKVLIAPNESFKNFSYIGKLNNGVPSGFGYLLNTSRQLISCAYWVEGFPVILYSVNNYYNSKSVDQFHRYISPISSNGKYGRRMIDFDVSDYSDSDIRTFKIYIGECNEKNVKSGFGCYFFEETNKTSLQYYRGNWGGNGYRKGEGTHYSNGQTFSGTWVNGEISSGTITWPDNSTYTGSINKFRMNGIGKKTYSNGGVEEGLFENGTFSKSLEQLQQELIQKQQEQEQEYIRKEEANRIASAETDKNPRENNSINSNDECSFKFSKPILTLEYIDNRKKCCCCGKRYAKYSSPSKGARELEMVMTTLTYNLLNHWKQIGASESHKEEDIERFAKFYVNETKKNDKASFALLNDDEMRILDEKMLKNCYQQIKSIWIMLVKNSFAFDPNYNYIVSGSSKRKVKKYNADASQCDECYCGCR